MYLPTGWERNAVKKVGIMRSAKQTRQIQLPPRQTARDACVRSWGGSEIINPFGNPVAKGALCGPDQIFAELFERVPP
jgi:hypothetical protein